MLSFFYSFQLSYWFSEKVFLASERLQREIETFESSFGPMDISAWEGGACGSFEVLFKLRRYSSQASLKSPLRIQKRRKKMFFGILSSLIMQYSSMGYQEIAQTGKLQCSRSRLLFGMLSFCISLFSIELHWQFIT